MADLTPFPNVYKCLDELLMQNGYTLQWSLKHYVNQPTSSSPKTDIKIMDYSCKSVCVCELKT